jgi:hypothetical protein
MTPGARYDPRMLRRLAAKFPLLLAAAVVTALLLEDGSGERGSVPLFDRIPASELTFAEPVDALDVDVRDADGRHPAHVRAETGRDDVAIVIAARRFLRVRMSSYGRPIPWGHVKTTAGDPAWCLGGNDEVWPLTELGEDGAAELPLPDGPFAVDAMAPGFARATLGPFHPTQLGSELVLELARGQAAYGRVLGRGLPVDGARVALGRSGVRPGDLAHARGVARDDTPFDLAAGTALGDHDATTAADGGFVVALGTDGPYSLAVEAAGFGRTFFGPFDWDRERGAEGLVLELQPPGTLVGRVTPPVGTSAEGLLVAASDGGGVAWTSAVDSDGAYRFEGLAPGLWQIREAVPPIDSPAQLAQASASAPREPRWDALVPPGGTARFDLDLRARGSVRLAGRVRIDGAPPETGYAALLPASGRGEFGAPRLAEASLDPDGAFTVAVSTPEEFILELCVGPPSGRTLLRRRIELVSGETRWEPQWTTGAARIAGSAPRTLAGEVIRRAYLRHRLPDGSVALSLAWIEPLENGEEAVIERAPAGHVDLVVPAVDGAWSRDALDDTAWRVIGSATIPTGGEVRFTLE